MMLKYQTFKKFFTSSDYNKFTKEMLDAKIKEKGSVNKSDITHLIQNSDLNTKLTTLATKAELKTQQDKIVKLQIFDSTYFRDKSYFENDGTQKYLVFRPIYICYKKVGTSNRISTWKSKGLSNKSINLLFYLIVALPQH